MSCLIQAIMPLSKLNASTYARADTSGECEFGTWEFGPWESYLARVIGEPVYRTTHKGFVVKDKSARVVFRFSPAQCAQVCNHLKRKLAAGKRVKFKQDKRIVGVMLFCDTKEKNPYINKTLCVREQWVKNLIEIFSHPDVVWYVEGPRHQY
jgi:hypothetical protein